MGIKKSSIPKKNTRYLQVRRKTARVNSGNTIMAKRFVRAMDKDILNIKRIKPLNGTKGNKKA